MCFRGVRRGVRQDYSNLDIHQQHQLDALSNLVELGVGVSGVAMCRGVPGLTRAQLEQCQRRPDVTLAALHGLQLAVDECRHQFRQNRWNCSSLATRSNNPHTSLLFQRGTFVTFFFSSLATYLHRKISFFDH